jgi:hypothetical protein
MSYLGISRTVRSIRRSVSEFDVQGPYSCKKKSVTSCCQCESASGNTLRVDHVDLLQLLSIAY